MKRFFAILVLLLIPLAAMADGENTYTQVEGIINKIPFLSSYSSAQQTAGGMFDFHFDDGAKATVSVDDSGNITSYIYQRQTYPAKKRLPSISKAQAAEAAIGFAQNAAADIFPQLNIKNFTNTYSNTTPAGFNIRFTQSVHSISYSGNSISLWVDAQMGVVTRFNRVWDKNINFSPIDSIISEDEAYNKFFENIGFELRYNRKITKGKVTPYLVFVPKSTDVIDAAGGNAISSTKTTVGNSYNEMLALYEKTAASTMDYAPSAGMMPGSKAQERARDIPEIGISADYTAMRASYSKNTNNDYLVTVEFEKPDTAMANSQVSVTFDASNLLLVGFYNKEAEYKTSPITLDGNRALAAANKFIDTYLKEYKQFLAGPRLVLGENGEGKVCSVIYERLANGIIYKSNGATFTINSEGDIISYSFIWDDTQFDSLEGLLSLESAEKIFRDKIGLSLIYMKTADDVVRLAYTVNPQISAIIDAKSGQILLYDGSVAKGKKSLSYVDLENHYAKEQATALADIDIFVSEGDVDLDKPIVQKDFIILLASIAPDGMPIFQKQGGISDEDLDMLYSAFVTKGILDKSEINYEGLVARQDAVKYLLRTTGYKDVAELPGIFKRHFKDSDFIDPALYGYVSLARGLDLIRGSNGYFYPDLALSNGDALIMVYNYLNGR